MDNEKIKELAQKYAEYRAEPFDDAHDEIALEYFKDTTAFLRWLFKTHCIVEKEKINALYSKMELDGNHVDSDNDWAVYEAMDELEKIFGEELFNDKEK